MTAIQYGTAETIGFRQRMEDAHRVWDHLPEGIFAAEVYDGHGGSRAALVAARFLMSAFLSEEGDPGGAGRVAERFTAEALREAYLATDRHILDMGIDSGTAAAGLYVQKDRFLVANAGDVRIVVSEGATGIQLTVDHKPDLPEERGRIETLGGKVIQFDVPRVQGSLAMSRALGDMALKPFVSAEPRIADGVLGRHNEIAVIACDGIWDVVTNQEALALARGAASPNEAALSLQKLALERGSMDNITVIVLDLKNYTSGFQREHLEILRIADRAAG